MSERIDHVAEAQRLLAAVNEVPTEAAGALPIDVWATEAQAHATLALVEQQRIANLIAILASAAQGVANQTVAFGDYMNLFRQINPEIVSALGIKTGDNDD